MHLDDAPRFLTYEQYADLIQRVQYKPDWTISVFLDPYEGPTLYLTADVVDGYDHSKTVPLRIRSSIPHHRTPGEFYTWLQWRLIQIEIHEAREYFHVDDEPWSDPHDVIEPYPRTDTEREVAPFHDVTPERTNAALTGMDRFRQEMAKAQAAERKYGVNTMIGDK